MTRRLEPSFPAPDEAAEPPGQILVSSAVVASIAKLAALEIRGVVALAGNPVEQIAGLFAPRETGTGVRVVEDAAGRYRVGLRLVVEYGLQLAQTAVEVQANVRQKVEFMTGKEVAGVDVTIEEVRLPGKDRPSAPSTGPAADGEAAWFDLGQ